MLLIAALAFTLQDPHKPARVDTLVPRDVVAALAADSASGDSTRGKRGRRPAKRATVTDAHLRSAFSDAPARELLLRARDARMRNDSSIRSYDASAYQRLSVGMGFKQIGRDRLMLRVENSAHIKWDRKVGVQMELTGARTVMPMLSGLPGMGGNSTDAEDGRREMSEGMQEMAPIPWYPGKDALWAGGGLAKAQVDEGEIIHPLASGSEAYYRYETGDSIMISLSPDRRIRLRELKITAREPRWNLIVGSFWFDVETGQLVRAVYRLSTQMDIWKVAKEQADSSDTKDMDEIPTLVKPLIFPMIAEIQAITVEYGLFNGVWMPRVQAIEAFARVSFMRVPVKMEERYKYASVNVVDPSMRPIVRAARSKPDAAKDSASRVKPDSASRVMTDSARAERRRVREAAAKVDAARRKSECDATGFTTHTALRYQGTLPVAVRVPCDTMKLVASSELPPSIYDAGEELFGVSEREELVKALGLGLQPGWAPRKVELHYDLAQGALRYNRAEGLSGGAEARQTLGGGYTWRGQARYNTGEATVLAELGVERTSGRRTIGLNAYKRTAVASDWGNPLNFGASLASVLYAHDEGFYFRTLGAEFTWRTEPKRDIELRAFFEQQSSIPVTTRWSLFGGANDVRFVPNVVAREGTVGGVEMRLRRDWGLDPFGWRGGVDLRGEGALGDWRYGRGALDVNVTHPIAGRVSASLTAGGGWSLGALPPQRHWYLGGLQTVRGESPGTSPDRGAIAGSMGGTAYWLTRTELGWGAPAWRAAVFFDAGWAGDKAMWRDPGRPLTGTGIGFSALDGLFRLDIARGLSPVQQWRTDFSVEARF